MFISNCVFFDVVVSKSRNYIYNGHAYFLMLLFLNLEITYIMATPPNIALCR